MFVPDPLNKILGVVTFAAAVIFIALGGARLYAIDEEKKDQRMDLESHPARELAPPEPASSVTEATTRSLDAAPVDPHKTG